MKCYKCGKGKLTPKTTEIAGEVRGEKLSVLSEAMVCGRCGFQVLSDEQSATYTVAISDAYRKQHGLLTSKELRECRGRLRLSQRAFAAFLKVSVASIKRWEAGLIQDEAHDQLIRLRTDLDAAKRNVGELGARLGVMCQSQPQVTEVPFRVRRPESPEWVSDSPSVGGVTLQPGFLSSVCRYA